MVGTLLSLKCATLQDWPVTPTLPGLAQEAKVTSLSLVPHLILTVSSLWLRAGFSFLL